MRQSETKIVAYYRVSTQQQGRSGLGIEAQKKMVADYAAMHGAKIVGEFEEVESGRKHAQNRPELKKAIAAAKAKRATLCFSKLDRAGRRAADVLGLLENVGVPVVFADYPHGSQLQIGIMAVVAEEEARAISARTKAALAAAKARGTQLGSRDHGRPLARYRAMHGNLAACEGVTRAADKFAEVVRPYIAAYARQQMSDAAIAEALNADGIETRREGGRWHETSVRRLRARLAI